MIYKLPTDRVRLSKDMLQKVADLPARHELEWNAKYNDYCLNAGLYESLLKRITSGAVKPEELNTTISNKKELEACIAELQDELCSIFNVPEKKPDVTRAIERATLLSRRGASPIRPSGAGGYAAPKIRKPVRK
jgi:hypothetical protein